MTEAVIERKAIADGEICYSLRRGSGRGILFLHGLGCSKACFERAFDKNLFPLELTLVAPDLLGFGESSKPDECSYSLESHVPYLVDLILSCNLNEIYVVGHSMGGAIGLLCLDHLPGLAGYFCLEGNLVLEDCTVAKRVASVTESQFVNRIFPMAPLKFRCRGLASDPEANPRAFYRCSKSLLAWSEHGSLLQKFIGLSVKKAYIYGEASDRTPVLRHLEKQHVVRIGNCGHFMMMDRPEETYGEIMARL